MISKKPTENKHLVDIRAIKNKKSIKAVKLDAENAHKEFYGDSDDSDDERILSKIGRLQTQKYKDKDFIGYDENLQKIPKKQAFGDKIEEFIAKSENKDWWRIVRDELNNQDVVLTDKQLQLLDRIRTRKTAVSLASNDYFFEFDDFNQFDLMSNYNPKRRFIASKWERIKINKIVQGIKLGRIKLHQNEIQVPKTYDVWEKEPENQLSKYLPPRILPAKQPLPTNVHSYNPPEEYLFTAEEKEQWMQQDPEEREIPFIPQQFRYLRNVPSSEMLTRDIFNRCLDLYLAPRVRRRKLQMKSSDFLPELPSPEDLKPFPTHLNTDFGNIDPETTGAPRSITIRGDGQLICVCYEKAVAFFDTKTTRCLYTYYLQEEEEDVKFNGIDINEQGLVGLVQNGKIILVNSHFDGRKLDVLEEGRTQRAANQEKFVWQFQQYAEKPSKELVTELIIQLPYTPYHINFHSKGDYFVTTQPYTQVKSHSVLVHCLSKAQTTQPFHNMKATTEVQQAIFHPTQPNLLIMTNKNVFVYSLTKQQLVKKLLSGNQQNSSISVHPYGENVLIGSNDHKVCWFDLEMGKTPFKKMSYHSKPVTRVRFHRKYPLFASSAEDGQINIFHCRVSQSDLAEPVILPLKVLKAKRKLPVKDIVFHPSQPWAYTLGLDGNVSLWT